MSAVAGSGHVRPEYRHIEKRVRSRPGLSVEGAVLKWYDIAPADEPVPAAIRSLARTDLWAACAAKTVALSDDLGFVILHRCGPEFYFLITCTWRNDNELWETVWAKNGAGRCRVCALAGRGPAPARLLRLGARRRLPRAAGLEPLPALGARCGCPAGLPGGRLGRRRVRQGRLPR